jgi:hypothetical protein
VVEAPPGEKVVVTTAISDKSAIPAEGIRLTNDPTAQAISPAALAKFYSCRGKEVIAQVKTLLGPEVHFTTHTLLCVRRVHQIDDRADFSCQPPHGSRLYTQGFIDWLVAEYQKNAEFFVRAIEQYGNKGIEITHQSGGVKNNLLGFCTSFDTEGGVRA